jgi:arylsulfatase A-like enzyme
MRRRLYILVLLSIILLVAVWRYGKPLRHQIARSRYPYVVLVSFDTLHVNYTSPYNPEVEETPNLEAFARDGVVFKNAYTDVPITLPSHTALLSGSASVESGVMVNGHVVPEGVNTIAEILKDVGYETAAFISLGVLSRKFGLDQGFDVYDDPFQVQGRIWYRSADEVYDSVREWFRESQRGPFFIWAHFSDPHEPYLPVGAPPDTRLTLDGEVLGEWNLVSRVPVSYNLMLPAGRHELTWHSLREPKPDDRPETAIRLVLHGREILEPYALSPIPGAYEGTDLRPDWTLELLNPEAVQIDLLFEGKLIRPPPSDVLDNYRLEVEYADHYLGELRKLFESDGIEDEVLWVLVSHHGEGLFRHDALGHAEFVYEDQLRVLWMMSGPGIPRGTVVSDAVVRMNDIAPTLLDVMWLSARGDMDGVSRVGCWEGEPCRIPEEWWAYGVRHETNRLMMLAGYRWPYKWLWKRGEGRRAFQLIDDPREERDLLDVSGVEHPADLRSLAEAYREQRQRLGEHLRASGRALDHEKHMELLRSLGYIGSER